MIEPKLTIGMAAYRGDQLERALRSLVNQTFTDFQLIIYDDCSPDNLEDIIDKINDDRTKYIRFNWNVGGNKNFTRLALNANTPYFMWATDDDFWYPTYIEKCIEVLENESDIIACYSQAELVDENDNLIAYYRDTFTLESDDQIERIVTMAENINLGHYFWSIFRTSALQSSSNKQTPVIALGTRRCLIHDDYFYGELILEGKVRQLPERLFRRTRLINRQENIEVRHARLQRLMFGESRRFIRMPFIRHVTNYLELVHQTTAPPAHKDKAIKRLSVSLKNKFQTIMKFELDRLVMLVLNDEFDCRFGETQGISKGYEGLQKYQARDTFSELLEAYAFFPRAKGLNLALSLCAYRLGQMAVGRAYCYEEIRLHGIDDNTEALLCLFETLVESK
jgi:glycosyltransferase involved in cell wall biosynthesis